LIHRSFLAALVALAAAAPAASGAVHFQRVAGYDSPGTPAKYNRVGILKFGRPSAKNVLVLNPGTSASAAYFAPLARSVVARARGWQVWSVERRENLLEDQSVFDKGKARKLGPQKVFDYYLGYLEDKSVKKHFQAIPDSEVDFAHDWGMQTELEDLDRVVSRAKKLGGRVVVGGHSLGGTITTAYATWDFNGRVGASGLAGLVFIDGGSGPTAITREDAEQQLADLRAGTPWLTFGGIPAPFTGLFNTSGALGVITSPNMPSIGQEFGLLPANLKPPVRVTNAGQYGFALDTATSPASLVAAQAHLGHLAKKGSPRGWDNAGELTPLRRYAVAFGGWGLKGLDGTAWYHPARLTLDGRAVAAGNANEAQDVLGVRATHGHDLPHGLRILAFGAALGGTRVLDAATALAQQSGIPSSNLELIDRHETYAHNDPNTAAPRKNAFLKRLVPYLKRVAR
jgi:pimeloyl-ACP methyl ester carboxylesterase